jgi:CelD/BcsL family acetyltransferase involved in cellulose biosynthesis
VLSGIRPELLEHWRRPGLQIREHARRVARFVDLESLRCQGKSCAEAVSANSRRRLRKTRQALEGRGPMVVEVASNRTQALEFLAELKDLHNRRWADREGGSAFAQPIFEAFAVELIATHFDLGIVQLLRVRAGKVTVGVLYNFVYRGRVLQYQSGIHYGCVAGNEAPGLLTHALAIDYNAAQGHAHYDMLAGDSQYKRSLATGETTLWWGTIERQRPGWRLECALRWAGTRVRSALVGTHVRAGPARI